MFTINNRDKETFTVIIRWRVLIILRLLFCSCHSNGWRYVEVFWRRFRLFEYLFNHFVRIHAPKQGCFKLNSTKMTLIRLCTVFWVTKFRSACIKSIRFCLMIWTILDAHSIDSNTKRKFLKWSLSIRNLCENDRDLIIVPTYQTEKRDGNLENLLLFRPK